MNERAHTAPTVVLLHGLGQGEKAMRPLRRAISRAGYPTWSCDYPSRKGSIEQLGEHVASRIEQDIGTKGPLMFVTHSLGGVLLRHFAPRFHIQRTVMLCPPNRGSRVAQRLSRHKLYQKTFGPSGRQLAHDHNWPAPPEPFAVIAGNRPLSLGNPTSWLSGALRIFPAHMPNDGTVAVQETLHPKMSDFAVVGASHTGILAHPRTPELVLNYLADGRFDREPCRTNLSLARRDSPIALP